MCAHVEVENNLWGSGLSFYHVGPEEHLGSPGLVASAFTCWAILTVFYGCLWAFISTLGTELCPLEKQEGCLTT